MSRPVGEAPAGPLSFGQAVGRAGWFAAAGILAALNAQADQIIHALTDKTLSTALIELGGISAIIWFAMFAALKIGLEDETNGLSRRDLAVLAIVGLLSFLPLFFSSKIGLFLAGGYLFATSREGNPSRRVSLILLALTGPLVWGRVLLTLFGGPILALDAHIVGSVIGSAVRGNIVDFARPGMQFFIATGCSSVHNISIGVLLWTTAIALFKIRIDWRYVGIGVAMIAWMFFLNIARLATIGLYPDDFGYLHDGGGAALFGWAGLLGAALLAGFGIIRAAERQQ